VRSTAQDGTIQTRPAPSVRAPHVPVLWLVAALVLLAGAILLGLMAGAAGIPIRSVIDGLASRGSGSQSAVIIWQLRLPRVLLAGMVGGTLAVAGAAYQGVFSNPLADPYLLGAAAGAELGATIAIAFVPAALGANTVPVLAFLGAAGAVGAAFVLGRSAGAGRSPTMLILAGVAIASFLTAIQTFVQQRRSDVLRQVYSFTLGRLGTVSWGSLRLALPYVLLAVVVIMLHRRHLDVLSLGDDEARSLGINVGRARLALVVAATVGTAAVVAVAGAIAFVGIIVPHTVRLAVGSSYRIVVPLSLILGAAFLILADTLSRTLVAPGELPIGVITAFFGAPFFLVVLRSGRGFGR
jgi:iron complex transport system permease protein